MDLSKGFSSIEFSNIWKDDNKVVAIPHILAAKAQNHMAFFNSAVGVLQTLVVALGAGLGIWGAINLLEGYGNDNRAMRS